MAEQAHARSVLSGPYDPSDSIAAVPPGARVRGMFFEMLQERAQREHGRRIVDKSYSALIWYPMKEYMELLVEAARLFHPGVPIGEGLRRTGWTLYDDFESTMVGKAIFAVAGRSFERLSNAAHKAYEVSYEPCLLRARLVGPHRVQVIMDPVWVFPDTYQLGAWEGAVRFCQAEPEIELHWIGPGQALLDIQYRKW